MMFGNGRAVSGFAALLIAAVWYIYPAKAQVSAPYREASTVLAGEGNDALEAGEYNAALVKFEQALVADPANVEGYVGLGRLYYAVKSLPLSQKYFEIALSLAPVDMRILELSAYTEIAAESPDGVDRILKKMETICISGSCEELQRVKESLEDQAREDEQVEENN